MRQHRYINIKIGLAVFLSSMLLTILISMLQFPDQMFPYKDVVIKIENTGDANSGSSGKIITIQEVLNNGLVMQLDNANRVGNWTESDGAYTNLGLSQNAFLEFRADGAENLTLYLSKRSNGGIAQLYLNDKPIQRIDLYSAEQQEYEWIYTGSRYFALFEELSLFLTIFLLLFGLEVGLFFFMRLIKKKGWKVFKTRKMLGIAIYHVLAGAIMCLLALMQDKNAVFEWHGLGIKKFLVFYGVGSVTVSIWLFLIQEWMKDKSRAVIIHRVARIAALVLMPVISFYVLELMQGGSAFDLPVKAIAGNLILYYMVYLVLFGLMRRYKVSLLIGGGFFIVWGIVNYFVQAFRGNPFLPRDLLLLKTAFSVADNYVYAVNQKVMMGAAVLLFCGLLVMFLNEVRWKKRRVVCLAGISGSVAAAAVFLILFFNTSFAKLIGAGLNWWSFSAFYQEEGVVFSFAAYAQELIVKEPEGYSVKNVEAALESYQQGEDTQNEASQENRPNIITIMNESFADFSMFSDKEYLEECTPFLHSLKENTVKGSLLVSNFGGGTCNTEFEFLTGNTMGFYPNTIPYQQYVLDDMPGLVSGLNAEGYRTIGMHPFWPGGYNRSQVYDFLGFDEKYFIEDYTEYNTLRGFVDDESDYSKIKELYESKAAEERLFIFNVTMQNHGGYERGGMDYTVDIDDYDGNKTAVQEYLSLVKKSDEAVKELVQYFENEDEPTVIVFFGDHQPKLQDDFFVYLLGTEYDNTMLKEYQQYYEVPFFIWANYDIEEEDNVELSTNFFSAYVLDRLGMPKSAFQNFLLDVRSEVPVMNSKGYRGNDGNWYYYNDETEYSEILKLYKDIEYYDLFDTKNRKDQYFTLGKINVK